MPEFSKLIVFVSAAVTAFVQGGSWGMRGQKRMLPGISGNLLLTYSAVY